MFWLCLILLILLFILLSTFICYRNVFSVPKQTQEDAFRLPNNDQYNRFKAESIAMIQHALSISPYEDVWIRSYDGLKLHAKYYERFKDAPLQIMFHGYRSGAERDFCGGLPFALENGYNVLLIDQRAHGKSEGKCLSFGVNERFDCKSWIQYAVDRFGSDIKIVLYGMSMGSATVLMASSLSLPENVRGIIADCGFTSPADIIKKVMKGRGYPIWPVYPMVRLSGKLFGGFDIESASATQAMPLCTIPVFLIHGEDDRFVPCEMSRINYELCASKNKKLLTVPNAGHGISYMEDKELYLKEVRDFLASIL